MGQIIKDVILGDQDGLLWVSCWTERELTSFIDTAGPTCFMFNNLYMFEDAARFMEHLRSVRNINI